MFLKECVHTLSLYVLDTSLTICATLGEVHEKHALLQVCVHALLQVQRWRGLVVRVSDL